MNEISMGNPCLCFKKLLLFNWIKKIICMYMTLNLYQLYRNGKERSKTCFHKILHTPYNCLLRPWITRFIVKHVYQLIKIFLFSSNQFIQTPTTCALTKFQYTSFGCLKNMIRCFDYILKYIKRICSVNLVSTQTEGRKVQIEIFNFWFWVFSFIFV